ncbi:MAG: hypothetical protein ACOYMA_02035 [Bacteroidia bacterium]
MRLKITDTNFTTKYDWLFKLADENGNDFFIMNTTFYEKHGFKSPVTKKELDSYDNEQWVNVIVEKIDGMGIVVGV